MSVSASLEGECHSLVTEGTSAWWQQKEAVPPTPTQGVSTQE